MSRKKKDNAAAMAALRKSAAENGGTPSYADVARDLGESKVNLHRWWLAEGGEKTTKGQAADRRASMHILPPPADQRQPPPLVQDIDPRTCLASEFYAWKFQEISKDLNTARNEGAATALATLHKAHVDTFRECRIAAELEKARGKGLSRDEALRVAADMARRASPEVRAVFVAESRERREIA